MQDSVFTKIIKGEIPAHKLYEDDLTLVFLDIHPVVEGHTLVIPKKQIDQLWDLPDEDYMAVMRTSKLVARRLKQVLGTERVGVKVVGLDVPHAHVQLLPFSDLSEYNGTQDISTEPEHQQLAALAAKLSLDRTVK